MSLELLKKRINYKGGKQQNDRMIEDKLKSLKKALLYSYQSATAILQDGREFRCLINKDKINNDYDNKILSIPFKDICLNEEKILDKTSKGEQETNIKAGDVIEWKENKTHWLVYLQRLEEIAYFRAELRRCRYEVKIGDKTYKVYVCGPSKENIVWHTKGNMQGTKISWNDLNYDLEMYITKDEDTLAFLHRFTIVKIEGKNYEVQAVDSISVDGIIEVALKETYQNTIIEEIQKEEQEEVLPPSEEENKEIQGEKIVYPYEEYIYSIDKTGGEWIIDNPKKAEIISKDNNSVTIFILSGKSSNFNLLYKIEGEEDIVLNITIDSL